MGAGCAVCGADNATIFALYPVWFAILASGRLGDRLYTLNLLACSFQRNGPSKIIALCCSNDPFLPG